ncbi:hypothetical protein [Zavarzinella formosa]|uniref:hypothetical protein n=1 Tax=Zavarzinella formosa TaxID=360055 RepID=UPI0002F96BE0|nr:hypothetical protein [Zavarzinella formosa]
MTKFNILTSGNGCLPAGKRVGFIEASNPREAEDNLIKSGQITEKWRGLFRFEEQP